MAEISLRWIAFLLLGLFASRLLPARWRMDWFAACGFLFLGVNAPLSCLAFVLGALLTAWAVRAASVPGASRLPLALVVAYAAIILLFHGSALADAANRSAPLLRLVGAGYFACRQVHMVFEAYAGRLEDLTLGDQLRYQFFLPVLLVGPIHRIKPFTRACARRREDPVDLFAGLERALFGAAKVGIIAGALVDGAIAPWLQAHGPAGFAGAWLSGLLSWVSLYFLFGGYSDIAIGFSRAFGVAVEENFRRPWAARNLIEFWQRWHMTLSGWCRDYVYAPLAAATRQHFLALMAAMLVMGIWHEVSAYYLLWGVYHASGIAVCRLLQRNPMVQAMAVRSPVATSVAARASMFGWLAGSAPVVTLALGPLGVTR